MVQQIISDEDHDCFGRFSNTFTSEGSPIFFYRYFGSIVSKTTSIVLEKDVFSYMASAGVRELVRTRGMSRSCRHSSRIMCLLECVVILEHCICT